MKWVTCHKCNEYALVDESEVRPETACDDLTFAECEAGALEKLHRGDRGALLNFIDFCFFQERDVPVWAQEKLCDAVEKARDYKIKSWDEVFGRPMKKGKQLAAARRKDSPAAAEVWRLINERRRAGEKLDKALFEAVGKKVGIGGATVTEEIYLKISRHFREQEEAKKHGAPEGVMRRAKIKVKAVFEPPFNPHEDS